jgi:hypothetical protein
MEATSDNIHLFVDIEGHRNDEGGFTTEMFLVQKQLFTNILPAFTSSITMPLGKIEAGEADLETVLQTDVENAKENPNEEIYQDNLDDLPPEEDFVAEMELVVSYHEESESLIWGFGDREHTNELTADLAKKEIELES